MRKVGNVDTLFSLWVGALFHEHVALRFNHRSLCEFRQNQALVGSVPGEPNDHQCGATSGPGCSRGFPGDFRTRVATATYRRVFTVDNRGRASTDQPRTDNRQDLPLLAPVPVSQGRLVG